MSCCMTVLSMQIPQFYFYVIIFTFLTLQLNIALDRSSVKSSNSVECQSRIQGKVIEIKVELRISKHIYQNLFSPIAIIFPMIGNCFQ